MSENNRQTLLRELLTEIRDKRAGVQKRVKKYHLILKCVGFLITLMNIITLIVLVLVISLDQDLTATICSLVNHALMFLIQTLQDGSGLRETYSRSKHCLEEIIALDRDLSLILTRNHLTEADTKEIYIAMTDRLASLEQTMLE